MDLALSGEEAAFADELRSWLTDALTAGDPPPSGGSFDDEVEWGRRWQARLAEARWVAIHWPATYGGRDATPVEVALYNSEYARARAPQPVNRVGLNHAGPTLLVHGDEEQRRRWLPGILDASEIWCQLFSEPGAGSDLAALSTRGRPVQGGWLVSGQKVWTSYATVARWGLCLARTDREAPRHRGISCLVIDMEDDGVDVRPLRQLTGESEFNEVFLDDVFVSNDQLVGPEHDGWAVASTTLAHERGVNFPFKEQVVHEAWLGDLVQRAASDGSLDNPLTGDELVDAFVASRLLRLHNWRTLSRLGRGAEPGPETSLVKLAWEAMTRKVSDCALALTGVAAPLEAGATDVPDDGKWQRQWMWSHAATIAGGTTEIQKNVVAERLLGLPRG